MNNQPSKIEEFNQDSLRQIAREIVIRRYSLKIHWIIYILVNFLLFVINFMTDYHYPWHIWALFGWGLGLSLHTFSFIFYRKGWIASSSKGLVIYHCYLFINVNLLLLFINWFTDLTNTISWFFYPFLLWSLIFIGHLSLYLINRPKPNEDARKSWIERQVDKELQKVKRK